MPTENRLQQWETKSKLKTHASALYCLLLLRGTWKQGLWIAVSSQCFVSALLKLFLCFSVGIFSWDGVLHKILQFRLPTDSKSSKTAPTWVCTTDSILQEWTAPSWFSMSGSLHSLPAPLQSPPHGLQYPLGFIHSCPMGSSVFACGYQLCVVSVDCSRTAWFTMHLSNCPCLFGFFAVAIHPILYPQKIPAIKSISHQIIQR